MKDLMPATALRTGQGSASYLAEVCELLWPPPASATLVGRRSRASRVRRSTDGAPELIVLPDLRRPKLIVPSSGKAAAAAVRRYGEPGSAKTKLATRALEIVLAGGLGSVVGDRVVLSVPDGAETIGSYLTGLLGTGQLGQQVEISMHLGAARANRKPVLQLLTKAGDTIGFAKIGINPLTTDLVRSERAALTRLGSAGLATLRVPAVLGGGRWHGLEVLLLGALPVWERRTRLSATGLATAMIAVARAEGTSSTTLTASGYLSRLLGRLEQASDGPDGTAVAEMITRLAGVAGDAHLTFGCWHGDLTPWNLASTSAGLLVWDWERFEAGVPVGFDALHYWLQARVIRPREDPAQAAMRCVALAPDLLALFGVAPGAARLTALAYLAELSVRYLADHQAEAGARLGAPGGWLIPAIDSGLQRLGHP